MILKALYFAGIGLSLTLTSINNIESLPQENNSALETIVKAPLIKHHEESLFDKDEKYVEVAGLKLEKAKNILSKNRTVYYLPEDSLVRFLSSMANQKEFQVVYLPEQELLINITKESEIDRSRVDGGVLDSLISYGKNFSLIHNHNNIDLDPRKDEINLLYWLAPSPKDIFQYLSLGNKGADLKYGIITEYGLVTITTDKDTFSHLNHPSFGKIISEEAKQIQFSLIGVYTKTIKLWADKYRGVLGLSFKSAD